MTKGTSLGHVISSGFYLVSAGPYIQYSPKLTDFYEFHWSLSMAI